MNAIMQITEIHREQHQRHQERLARLWRGKPQLQLTTAPASKVGSSTPVAERTSKGSIASLVLAARDERIQELELDNADLRARILSQAEMLCQLDEDLLQDNIKRPVAVIVGEVLRDFPDVTWTEIISIRRTKRLIEPRKACMKAVYFQRPDLSSPQIGRIFRRDHTTVLHSVGTTSRSSKGEE